MPSILRYMYIRFLLSQAKAGLGDDWLHLNEEGYGTTSWAPTLSSMRGFGTTNRQDSHAYYTDFYGQIPPTELLKIGS
jgi:hypothetical protein